MVHTLIPTNTMLNCFKEIVTIVSSYQTLYKSKLQEIEPYQIITLNLAVGEVKLEMLDKIAEILNNNKIDYEFTIPTIIKGSKVNHILPHAQQILIHCYETTPN